MSLIDTGVRGLATIATALLAASICSGCLRDKIVVKVSAASRDSLGVYPLKEAELVIPLIERSDGPFIDVNVDKSWTGTVWVVARASITNSTEFAGCYESKKSGFVDLTSCITTDGASTFTNAPTNVVVLTLSPPR